MFLWPILLSLSLSFGRILILVSVCSDPSGVISSAELEVKGQVLGHRFFSCYSWKQDQVSQPGFRKISENVSQSRAVPLNLQIFKN